MIKTNREKKRNTISQLIGKNNTHQLNMTMKKENFLYAEIFDIYIYTIIFKWDRLEMTTV